jgi:hypothetical protein
MKRFVGFTCGCGGGTQVGGCSSKRNECHFSWDTGTCNSRLEALDSHVIRGAHLELLGGSETSSCTKPIEK